MATSAQFWPLGRVVLTPPVNIRALGPVLTTPVNIRALDSHFLTAPVNILFRGQDFLTAPVNIRALGPVLTTPVTIRAFGELLVDTPWQ